METYRAKKDFLGVTKGMEFPIDRDGEIGLPRKNKSGNGLTYIDPTQYPDDFELVEEPKYTDSDLVLLSELIENSWKVRDATCTKAIQRGIKNFKIIKAKNNS